MGNIHILRTTCLVGLQGLVNEIKVFRITAIHTQWLYCTRVSIHILLYIIICAIEVVYDNNIDNNNVTIYATPMFIIRIGGAVAITMIAGTGWVDQWWATNYLVNISFSDVYHGNSR